MTKLETEILQKYFDILDLMLNDINNVTLNDIQNWLDELRKKIGI